VAAALTRPCRVCLTTGWSDSMVCHNNLVSTVPFLKFEKYIIIWIRFS
jgi:hypothetical protein